jgi:hypothetical protein
VRKKRETGGSKKGGEEEMEPASFKPRFGNGYHLLGNGRNL